MSRVGRETLTNRFDIHAIQIDIVDTTEKAFECLRWLSDVQTPVMSVDVETSGFDWYDGKLRLFQLGSLTEGWAVPFEMFPGLVDELLTILDRRQLPLVGHNFKFDLHWIERHTRWTPRHWRLYHDTLPLSAVIDSSGSKALKDLSHQFVTPYARIFEKKLQADMKAGGWGWHDVPVLLESYWTYGVLDTILTANLFQTLLPMAADRGCLDAYEVERGCMPGLYSMERRGMIVDSQHCHDQLEILHARLDEINVEAYDLFGITNINSGDQLTRAFLDAGIELTAKTKTGRYQMNKKVLEHLVATVDHPLMALVGEHRSKERFAGSYYSNFLKFQRSDGRVHPQYNQSQARTGRMSAQFPAIQTLPRPETDKDVRNSFVADEGNVLISTDFTNIEARIFAHFAEEQGMLQAIRDGIDLHGYTAKEVYHLADIASKDDPRRQVAKNTLFCLLFGGGVEKIAATAHVSIQDAEEAHAGIHRAFPGIKTFQRRAQGTAKDNLRMTGKAWLRGVDGRILAMKENDDRYYAFTNWLIQGTATVLLKQRLAVIHQMGLTEYCIAAIHDEVVGEVPEEDAEEFSHLMAEAMLDEHQFAVPIVADPGKPATRLGDAK
jgi:DNA polymerase-1